jgi:hypothetical protein
LARVWKDDSLPRFQWGRFVRRAIGTLFLFLLARWCRRAALSTAQWIEPIKYVSLALLLAAVVALVWALILIGKLIWQLRLRGLLFVLVPALVLLTAFSALTADTPLPLHKQMGQSAQQILAVFGQGLLSAGQVVFETPGEFRLAYTGHRTPQQVGGRDKEVLLTPISANRPVMQQHKTPTGELLDSTPAQTPPPATTSENTSIGTPILTDSVDSPAPPVPTHTLPATRAFEAPDCPHPLARLTAPLVYQVIQDEAIVEGAANIENLGYYKFEFRREDIEDEWHWVASFEEPVQEGALGTWRVAHLPEGTYTFRLTVVNKQGNYPFPPCDVTVIVRH